MQDHEAYRDLYGVAPGEMREMMDVVAATGATPSSPCLQGRLSNGFPSREAMWLRHAQVSYNGSN
jgi:hypothetical protein